MFSIDEINKSALYPLANVLQFWIPFSETLTLSKMWVHFECCYIFESFFRRDLAEFWYTNLWSNFVFFVSLELFLSSNFELHERSGPLGLLEISWSLFIFLIFAQRCSHKCCATFQNEQQPSPCKCVNCNFDINQHHKSLPQLKIISVACESLQLLGRVSLFYDCKCFVLSCSCPGRSKVNVTAFPGRRLQRPAPAKADDSLRQNFSQTHFCSFCTILTFFVATQVKEYILFAAAAWLHGFHNTWKLPFNQESHFIN